MKLNMTYLGTSTYNPGQKSWDTFAKTPQIRTFPLHPLCNVDLKGPSHPESLQALSTLLGGEGRGRAVTKTVWYKQSSRLTQGIFHKCQMLHVFLPGVPRTFGQDCRSLGDVQFTSGLQQSILHQVDYMYMYVHACMVYLVSIILLQLPNHMSALKVTQCQ